MLRVNKTENTDWTNWQRKCQTWKKKYVVNDGKSFSKNGKIISVAGGGDPVAAISQSNYVNDFTYISTAGGAFLEMIAGQKLPGIEVLRK